MRTGYRLRCGIISAVIIMTAAFVCLPVRGQATVSLKLIKTLSKAELVSYEPFSKDGLLAVRVGDIVQLWDAQTGTLRASLPHHEKMQQQPGDARQPETDGRRPMTKRRRVS